MGITRTSVGGLFLSHEAYVRDLLERFKDHVPATAHSVEIPADPKIRFHANGFEKVKKYQAKTSRLRKEPRSVKVAFQERIAWCIAMAAAGNKAGRHLRGVSVR